MQITRLTTSIKALQQLGFTQVTLNALYKFGLASGHYRRVIQSPTYLHHLKLTCRGQCLPLPMAESIHQTLGTDGLRELTIEADEIVSGSFRQFGGEHVPIRLAPGTSLPHWTECETGKVKHAWDQDDIKFTWEPARFGWAFVLGRAYHISQDERYANAFWQRLTEFNQANPPYFGPNWTSGQEVGLRLMAWVWCAQVFEKSEEAIRHPQLLTDLANQVATHAVRIPATLVYARSQNNNHLLTEAAALYTAALALPDHPHAPKWLNTGSFWLGWCFTQQIDSRGEYVQHSMNYQRLMLQTALWVHALHAQQSRHSGKFSFPGGTLARQKLAIATRWVLSQIDPLSGQVPNLGANDGALIFPLSTGSFSDYRPLAQAAKLAFLTQDDTVPHNKRNTPEYCQGSDEMSLWFGLEQKIQAQFQAQSLPGILKSTGSNSWASLRAVKYTSRPSHADQLHLELWWQGENIACDAGTYRYTTAPPWDNQLTTTLVHNTVSVNALEQMTRAGRFLYLDWADATYIPNSPKALPAGFDRTNWITAQTNAYGQFGVQHTREVMVSQDERWLVEDHLTISPKKGIHQIAPICRLHWLLPDWPWEMEERNEPGSETKATLKIQSPHGWVQLKINATQPILRLGLLRAGELIHGSALLSPVFGWVSPTYNVKAPALSLAVEVQSANSFLFSSEFSFPTHEQSLYQHRAMIK
ncbi:MAG: alginate lyase family protein [Chloroflexota bacterium]